MEKFSSLENELSELSCFRIRTSADYLSEWKKLFIEQPVLNYSKGSVLADQQEKITEVYFVRKGFVEYTYSDSEGEQHLIDLMSFGNICGLQSLFSQSRRTFGALIALTDVSVSVLSADAVRRYIDKDHFLCRELLEELSRIVEAVITQSYSQTVGAEIRIAKILYIMADAISRQDGLENQNDILIGISQSDLARITHTSRVTVTKFLKKMKENGYLYTIYGGIVIRNLRHYESELLKNN